VTQWPRSTRSFNPTTSSMPFQTGATATSAVEPSYQGSPWLHPGRLFRAWKAHFVPWALIFIHVFGILGLIVGLFVLRSTFTLGATVQLQSIPVPFSAEKQTKTYVPPQLHPKAVHSLFEQTSIFKRLRPMAESREEDLKSFKNHFEVDYVRDAQVFKVRYTGASSPDKAERVLAAYCQIVVQAARGQILSQIQQDENYYRRNLEEADQRLKTLQQEIRSFRFDQGFVYLGQEIENRQKQVGDIEEELTKARNRLGSILHQIEELPKLIATLPEKVELQFPQATVVNSRLVAKREEVRSLAAKYKEKHPLLKAARKELAEFEEEYEREVEELRKEHMRPNPARVRLEEKLDLLRIEEPQVEREVEAWRQKLSEARAQLQELPRISVEFDELERKKQKQEDLIERLKARLQEIEIARNVSVDTLDIIEPADESNAVEEYKVLKVAVATAVALCIGAMIAAGIGFVAAIGDRRLRTGEDCTQILAPQRITRLPEDGESDTESIHHWLQDLSGHITRSYRKILVVPSSDGELAANFSRSLGGQIARSGMKTLVVADAGALGADPADPGLSDIIDQKEEIDYCILEFDDGVDVLPWGDEGRLGDLIPSGSVETWVTHVMGDYACILITPKEFDQAMLQRLAVAADCLVVMVDPNEESGEDLLDLVSGSGRPVAMAVLTE